MPAAGQDHGGWDVPPREFNEIERRGFADGITGAHRDMDNHRTPDVNNRDEYRSPQVPGDMREVYRRAFRRGYESAMAHPYTPAPSSFVQAIQRAWDAPPDGLREMQRRGFQDGIQGAHRDFENGRRPDPENRDEFRHPVDVPFLLQADYRDGFRKGYEVAMSHLMAAAPPPPPVRAWDAAPGEFNEIQRRGFRDGIEGAHRDYDNNRRPDPNNRDEYRQPSVPYEMVGQYREAFRRGYEVAMAHLRGDPGRR
jgi:ribosome modulation factor